MAQSHRQSSIFQIKFQQFWESWQCEYIVEGQAEELSQAIQQGHAVVVINGSFQLGAGVTACSIKGIMAAHWLHSAGLTLGGATDQSSYCSELFGLWGILVSLKHFTDDNQIVSGLVTIMCDSLLAIQKA